MTGIRSVGFTHIGISRDSTRQRLTKSVYRRNRGKPLDVNLLVAAQMVGNGEEHEKDFLGSRSDTYLLINYVDHVIFKFG